MQKRSAFLFAVCGLLLATGASFCQQNLIVNGGFENGLSGWSPFWSRKPGAGSVRVVSDKVHNGAFAALIEHHDAQDWSFAVDKRYAVKAGEIYELSAWISLEQAEWAELSVITYDKNQQVLEWSFSPRELDRSPAFTLFRTRFIIPETVRFITPRLIGGGECRLYADDVSLTLIGSSGPAGKVSLQNSRLQATIQLPGLNLEVEDKEAGIVFRSNAAVGLLPAAVDSTAGEVIVRCTLLSDDLFVTLRFRLMEDALRMQIEPDEDKAFESRLVFPGPFRVRSNDFIVVPRGTGFLLPVTEDYPFWEFGLYDWKSTMAFVGVTDLQSGYMLVSEDPWDTVVEFARLESLTTPQLLHEAAKNRLTPRTFYFVPISRDGYAAMCRWYRRHAERLGYVKTWREKLAENPNIERLRGAVDFWLLDEAMQTTATIDSLLLYGLDRAIISLSSGWYAPEDKSELIEYINESGYLSSRYDIYTDVWPPTHPEAPWYRTEGYPEDVIVNEDGSLRQGWLAYLDGHVPFQGYYTCSATHERYADKWLRQELATQPYLCRFIDVELASSLAECWSPAHPVTRKEDAHYRIRLLDRIKNGFGLVTGSE
ncbi:MAG: carbohydrate binding domain-containing protein, partial [candidate division KSB1 bacterium]|nr:carbohydrate binding domain-containing protein [candidate division KSB1 bacterium]